MKTPIITTMEKLFTTDPRPAWTFNNTGAFLFWMRTGAAELPTDWIDDADETFADSDDCQDCLRRIYQDSPLDLPNVNRRKDSEVSRLFGILDNLETGKDNQ